MAQKHKGSRLQCSVLKSAIITGMISKEAKRKAPIDDIDGGAVKRAPVLSHKDDDGLDASTREFLAALGASTSTMHASTSRTGKSAHGSRQPQVVVFQDPSQPIATTPGFLSHKKLFLVRNYITS
jgi:hypothetical protein